MYAALSKDLKILLTTALLLIHCHLALAQSSRQTDQAIAKLTVLEDQFLATPVERNQEKLIQAIKDVVGRALKPPAPIAEYLLRLLLLPALQEPHSRTLLKTVSQAILAVFDQSSAEVKENLREQLVQITRDFMGKRQLTDGRAEHLVELLGEMASPEDYELLDFFADLVKVENTLIGPLYEVLILKRGLELSPDGRRFKRILTDDTPLMDLFDSWQAHSEQRDPAAPESNETQRRAFSYGLKIGLRSEEAMARGRALELLQDIVDSAGFGIADWETVVILQGIARDSSIRNRATRRQAARLVHQLTTPTRRLLIDHRVVARQSYMSSIARYTSELYKDGASLPQRAEPYVPAQYQRLSEIAELLDRNDLWENSEVRRATFNLYQALARKRPDVLELFFISNWSHFIDATFEYHDKDLISQVDRIEKLLKSSAKGPCKRLLTPPSSDSGRA